MVCLACFSWKLVGIIVTATAVVILEIALAVSGRRRQAATTYLYPHPDTGSFETILLTQKMRIALLHVRESERFAIASVLFQQSYGRRLLLLL